MSLVASQHLTSVETNESKPSPDINTTEATLSTLLGAFTNAEHSSMDRSAADFSQSGLQSSYPHALTNAQSEESSADNASAAQYPQQQEVRSSNYSASATPTSEFYPTSARSATFSEHLQRQYHPASNHSGSSGDPSIAASSPTYASHNGQYSPYTPDQNMQHGYPQQHPNSAMYAQPRPDWAGYAGHPHMAAGGYAVSGAQTPTSAAPAGARPGQVYSFVPIPGAQQHKRPRRRYEEIERMYKCGWNGCEKAYGTLNHLNAHVTMQSHGQKRTPEEFKEIRKEWKARKKEEENQRKADEERARAQAVGGMATSEGQPSGEGAPAPGYQQPSRSVQLPPIGYQPGAHVPNQYQAQPSGNVQQLADYSGNQIQYSGYPASPYGQPAAGQMYSQHSQGGPQPKYEH